MSVLALKAGIRLREWHVRYVPITEFVIRSLFFRAATDGVCKPNLVWKYKIE